MIDESLNTGNNECSSDCNYPGSFCTIVNGKPKCACDFVNCISDHKKVCGEDGETYASYCDLMKISCIKQTNIPVAYEGQCSMGNILRFLNSCVEYSLIIITVRVHVPLVVHEYCLRSVFVFFLIDSLLL